MQKQQQTAARAKRAARSTQHAAHKYAPASSSLWACCSGTVRSKRSSIPLTGLPSSKQDVIQAWGSNFLNQKRGLLMRIGQAVIETIEYVCIYINGCSLSQIIWRVCARENHNGCVRVPSVCARIHKSFLLLFLPPQTLVLLLQAILYFHKAHTATSLKNGHA
jgi:hypothetical protein